jgi:diacylglycerol kinase (ATP)
MRFHFVVNPVAGRRHARALAAAVMEGLRTQGHGVTSHETVAPGDARRHVASLDAGSLDRLVVAGGDGTLREVVNSRPPPLPWPVAMLPVGTANLVSREVALPLSRDPDVVLRALLAAEPWKVSLLEIARDGAPPEHAVATIGVGLDGEIVRCVAAARARASVPGAGGYRQWVAPLWSTFRGYRFPSVEATLDGTRTYRGAAVITQNSRSYGGLLSLDPEARLDADAFRVVVARTRSRRDLPRFFLGALRGRLTDYHDVLSRPAQEVLIRARVPVAVQADGDPAGTTDLVVRLRPRSLTLLRRAPA